MWVCLCVSEYTHATSIDCHCMLKHSSVIREAFKNQVVAQHAVNLFVS